MPVKNWKLLVLIAPGLEGTLLHSLIPFSFIIRDVYTYTHIFVCNVHYEPNCVLEAYIFFLYFCELTFFNSSDKCLLIRFQMSEMGIM